MTRSSLLLATTAIAGFVGFASVARADINSCNLANGTGCVAGGGSTLAAPTYTAILPIAGDGYAYVGKGSGPSQCAILTNTGAAFFNTPTVNGYPLSVNIAASDAAFSAAQIASYNNAPFTGTVFSKTGAPSAGTAGAPAATCATTDLAGTTNLTPSFLSGGNSQRSISGNIIQVPSFGTPITIAYNLPGGTRVSSNSSIQFTDDQLCGIFSGKITSFQDPALTNVSVVPGTRGARLPTGTINVVYRGDGSGTSFLFTQHLGQVCNATNSNFFNAGFPNAGQTTFGGTTTFANLFPLVTGSTTLRAVPANFTAGNGSGGVQQAITSGGNSIGYLSPDYTQIVSIPTLASGVTTTPVVANVFNPAVSTTVSLAPTVANTDAALRNVAAPTNPADPTQYVPLVATPTAGYPIVGFTTIDLVQCHVDAATGGNLVSFLTNLYTDVPTQAVIRGNGFSPVPASIFNVINANILNNNGGLNLDIENANVCRSAGATGAGTFAGR